MSADSFRNKKSFWLLLPLDRKTQVFVCATSSLHEVKVKVKVLFYKYRWGGFLNKWWKISSLLYYYDGYCRSFLQKPIRIKDFLIFCLALTNLRRLFKKLHKCQNIKCRCFFFYCARYWERWKEKFLQSFALEDYSNYPIDIHRPIIYRKSSN